MQPLKDKAGYDPAFSAAVNISSAQLIEPGKAIAWRGPMAGNALSQLVDAHWGAVREIVVDMPPGTGDIQLSMIQKQGVLLVGILARF